MAGKSSATPETYSPSLTGQRKKRPPILTDSDWVRPDGRSLHQCRPACGKPSSNADILNAHWTVIIFMGSEEAKKLRYCGNSMGDSVEDQLVEHFLSTLAEMWGSVVRLIGNHFGGIRAVLRTGAVNSASGSAYAEFGNTKVIVSVFGPRESKKAMMYSDTGRLNCNVSYTTFATPVRGQAPETKDLSSMLHKALEGAIILKSFPKTTVDVFALVLESGGSDLPVITTCASLALADAGIMIYDMVASVSVCFTSYCLGKNILIDPVSEEESYQDGSLMITCMPSRNEVTQMAVTGDWSTPKINELCIDACSKLGKIMRLCLKEAATAPQD
ncbi:hypothetical protein DH2020_000205 [Rehmannia glutinosa]|uniref:Uncharacterized protein n=1 Tax=Rehmannia glutinosa TaxID=99300 RepID=A0ABR0XVU4_REHGL